MALPDPYDILGVPRNASTATIHSAYRRLAKEMHPDRGGDIERFRHLKDAYDLLSDPAHRQHFDGTGETPADKAEREAEDARFRTLAGDFLVSIFSQGGAPEFSDFAELARGAVAQHIQNADSQIAHLSALVDRLSVMRSRLHGPAPVNILDEVLQERLLQMQHTIDATRQQRARWIRLQQTLKDYVYDVFDENIP